MLLEIILLENMVYIFIVKQMISSYSYPLSQISQIKLIAALKAP